MIDLLDKVTCGDCLGLMRQLPSESIHFCMFSPPYWGLRDYGASVSTVWDSTGDSNLHHCEHEWIETKMTLTHENRNFSKGTQEDVHGEHGTTFIKKYDDKVAGFCSKCGAWRGQLGLEPTYQLYVQHMVEIGREVRRALRKDGSWYLNLGDTYAGSGCGAQHGWGDYKRQNIIGTMDEPSPQTQIDDVPAKCKLLIPYRVALALIDDGWTCRNDITWYKPNAMPSSVKDRLTCQTERIFHLVKSRTYYYDLDAIREPHKEGVVRWGGAMMKVPKNGKMAQGQAGALLDEDRLWRNPLGKNPGDVVTVRHKATIEGTMLPEGARIRHGLGESTLGTTYPLGANPGDVTQAFCGDAPGHNDEKYHTHFGDDPAGKNPGDFWPVTTKPFAEAHFAVYPEALCERPIKSSCPSDGIVLDPMCGSGTTLVVAKKLRRHFIGFDLNPNYCDIARRRLMQVEWPLERFNGG